MNPNDDGSYNSPGEGWLEFVPQHSGDYLRIVSSDGTTAYHFGEGKDGKPFVRELQTGMVQDVSWDIVGLFIPSRLAVKGIAATATFLWAKHQAKRAAFEAAVETLSKSNPNQIAKGISAVLKGKQPLNTLSRAEREAAARYYERVAREGTKGKFADAARQYNLERARYLREGGKVPPGTLREFMQRKGLN
ncbi:MAG TPA: hypothetical protein VHH35_14460 [Pyrinomonadaceae bacterium]|nr:hypothetical protein [Pyrinomonadaceae bacterium]